MLRNEEWFYRQIELMEVYVLFIRVFRKQESLYNRVITILSILNLRFSVLRNRNDINFSKKYHFYFLSFSLCLPIYSKAPLRIKLISYNIKNGEQGLDKIVEFLRKKKPMSLPYKKLIMEEREGRVNQTKYIAEKLKMNFIFGAAEKYSDGEYGNAIISRFPIQDSQLIFLSKGSRKSRTGEKRAALIATIVPDQHNHSHDFTFISTHFGVFNSDDSRRGRSGITLNQFINKPQ